MNVVVEERTKEIGIKMALGARDRWILRQFLLETLLITAMGGAIGFAISFAVCAVFPKFGVTEYVGDPDLSLSVAAADRGDPRRHGSPRGVLPGARRRRGSIPSWR